MDLADRSRGLSACELRQPAASYRAVEMGVAHLFDFRYPEPLDLPLVPRDETLPRLCSRPALDAHLIPDLDAVDRFTDAGLYGLDRELQEVERSELGHDQFVRGRGGGAATRGSRCA